MSRAAEHWFHQRAAFYVEAQLLYHLSQLGVWRLIAEQGPVSTSSIAGSLDLSEPALQAVLDFVHGVDHLLDHDEQGWRVSSFGQEVMARYGRGGAINFFDVRVGGYGPVWAGTDRLLRGEAVPRHGAAAAEGVYKVAARFAPGVAALVDELAPSVTLEVGVTTGLLETISGPRIGLDRDQPALDEAARRAGDPAIRWVCADAFAPATWAVQLPPGGLLFTIHFHELAARGVDRVDAWLAQLAEHLPGWHVLALEQPRLPETHRALVGDVEWLYAQANVLIHHLIGNGRILFDHEWRALLDGPGRSLQAVRPLGYLGYHAYLTRLDG